MHSTTLVLLEPPFEDLRTRANALLERHRLDEEDYKPGWKTDYWTTGDEGIRDEDTARSLGIVDDDDLAQNVCFVRRLPHEILLTCIVTPDGAWHDCVDFGWRLRNTESANNDALEQWRTHYRAVFAQWAHCVAVQFDTHS